jgi:hypothetical protein
MEPMLLSPTELKRKSGAQLYLDVGFWSTFQLLLPLFNSKTLPIFLLDFTVQKTLRV